jgi:hypothetical protein
MINVENPFSGRWLSTPCWNHLHRLWSVARLCRRLLVRGWSILEFCRCDGWQCCARDYRRQFHLAFMTLGWTVRAAKRSYSFDARFGMSSP